MRILSAVVFLVLGIGAASAQSQSVYKYDIGVIDSSIKCELGRVARALAREKIEADRLKATIKVSGEETISKKIGGGIEFIFTGKAGYEHSAGRKRGMEGVRNIHVDNTVNCSKRNIVDVGIYSCFREQKPAFIAGQTVTCNDTSKAVANIEAGGKFTFWVVGAELSGEYANTRVWTIDITAPPPPKG